MGFDVGGKRARKTPPASLCGSRVCPTGGGEGGRER